jgi:two-component SAPR family response regulator
MENHPEVDLLLTDVGLPGLNGRKLAEQASRCLPGVKILFISGYARNAIVHNGVLDPGVELLPKPFTMDSLARKLDQVLQSASS